LYEVASGTASQVKTVEELFTQEDRKFSGAEGAAPSATPTANMEDNTNTRDNPPIENFINDILRSAYIGSNIRVINGRHSVRRKSFPDQMHSCTRLEANGDGSTRRVDVAA
jgi:hypothetical protein